MSLSSIKLKTKRATAAVNIKQPQQQNITVNFELLDNLGLSELKSIPNIEIFLIPDLIPDLIDIKEKNGIQTIVDMITKYNNYQGDKIPTDLLYFHPIQEKHKITQQIEKDLILNKTDVIENDNIQCSNTLCKSRKVRVIPKQIRSADEPMSLHIYCTQCHKKEIRSG